MVARTGLLQVDPDRIDDVVRELTEKRVPRFREQGGFRGLTILADRGSGELIGISYWETQADLDATEELAAETRQGAAETGRAANEPARDAFEVLHVESV